MNISERLHWRRIGRSRAEAGSAAECYGWMGYGLRRAACGARSVTGDALRAVKSQWARVKRVTEPTGLGEELRGKSYEGRVTSYARCRWRTVGYGNWQDRFVRRIL